MRQAKIAKMNITRENPERRGEKKRLKGNISTPVYFKLK
ncbi:MAG: hypothetical protein ANABAC_1248 [Anaerolineae bacterium]|nr:MAG: hypothetical protein ANABAC_1248 [Anaerolineae bacterium]